MQMGLRKLLPNWAAIWLLKAGFPKHGLAVCP